MNTNRPASRYGVTILVGNVVRLEDGRTGTVETIDGDTLAIEVAKPRASRTAVIRSIDDLVETVFAAAGTVAHAA